MKIKNFILLIVFWTNYSVSAQEGRLYVETYWGEYVEVFILRDSIMVRDTVRDTIYLTDMKEIASGLNMSFDKFIHQFLQYSRQQKPDSSTIYISHLTGKLNEHLKNYKYISRQYWVNFPKDTFKIENKVSSLPQHIPDSIIFEHRFVLTGEKNTNIFLDSPSEQLKVLEKLLCDIKKQKASVKNKIALNFYFPDFSFKEKRAMAQFVKSASLVIDNIDIPEIRNLPLYFTFNKKSKDANFAFLVGLCEMADSIFVVNPSSLNDFEAIDKNADIFKFEKIKNQFYFVRFYTDSLPKIHDLSCESLNLLMNADYPNTWEGYFAGIIGIILLLIIGTVCYFFVTPFTNFIHEHYMYVFAGVIILITEIILLFVFMIEEMNSHTKVFNLWEILFVLVLLVLIIPLIKRGIKKNEIP